MADVSVWRCGHCNYALALPKEHLDSMGTAIRFSPQYEDALMRIREHRFGHLVDAMMTGSDDDLLRMCQDEDQRLPCIMCPQADAVDGYALCPPCLDKARRADEDGGRQEINETLERFKPEPSPDPRPVMEGIEALLRDDLPRARKLWYPVNEDGSFNR